MRASADPPGGPHAPWRWTTDVSRHLLPELEWRAVRAPSRAQSPLRARRMPRPGVRVYPRPARTFEFRHSPVMQYLSSFKRNPYASLVTPPLVAMLTAVFLWLELPPHTV